VVLIGRNKHTYRQIQASQPFWAIGIGCVVVEDNNNNRGFGARLRGESRAMAKQGGERVIMEIWKRYLTADISNHETIS